MLPKPRQLGNHIAEDGMDNTHTTVGRLGLRYVEWLGMFVVFSAFTFYQIAYVLPFVPLLFGVLNTLLIVLVLALLFLTRFAFYGLFHVSLTYCLIFFGLIPPLEVLAGAVYWGGSPSVFDLYTSTMLLSIVSIGVFAVLYRFCYGGTVENADYHRHVSALILVIISSAAAVIIYAYNGFSVASVMFRGGDFVQRVSLGQSAWLIYQYFVYPIPAICLVTYLVLGKRRGITTITLLLLFVAANPATGMARFQAAALYIAVLLGLIPRMWFQRSLMIGLLFGGIFLVMPILDKFRYFTENSTVSYSTSFIYAGHFDGFQMFALALQEGSLTWGRQLLGALLFFLPRAIWADKPISSGAFLADSSALDFDNISFPFFAEGYINFGFVGVAVFAAFLGWFAARYDTRFHRRSLRNINFVYYHFAGGLLFFLMRGSLMNGVSFAFGTYVALLGVVYLARRK